MTALRAAFRALPGLGALASVTYGLWLWAGPGPALVEAGVVVGADVLWARRTSPPARPAPGGEQR